jgi:hypothetical protein
MLHLPADRLAELVDNEPTAQELAHLQLCAACSGERRAFVALRSLAFAERERTAGPLLAWEEIRGPLAAAGMITPRREDTGWTVYSARKLRTSASHWTLRIAASFALVAVGIAAGRYSERAGIATASRATAELVTAASDGRGSSDERTSVSFTSSAAAMASLIRAQEDYQRAAAFLVASDTTLGPNTPVMFRQRLAALDELMGVTRSALARAPQDPVINSYYLATLGAREATIQQLELALPAGTRIDRF